MRIWLRYVVPLTLLAVIACAPLWWIALHAPAPTDVPHARVQMRVAWVLASTAWIWQLWLVAGVKPAFGGVSQVEAFTKGLRGLVMKLIPVLVSVVAILLGTFALVVPGLLLLVLLAPTGATTSHVEAVALSRASFRRTAITVALVILGGLAITLACQLAIVPAFGKKVAAPKLVPIRTFVRVMAIALTVYSPIAACAIARLTARRAR